jgi:hypothetical protein
MKGIAGFLRAELQDDFWAMIGYSITLAGGAFFVALAVFCISLYLGLALSF